MAKGRYINLTGAVITTGLILSSLFLLTSNDVIVQILEFLALQIIMGLTSVLLILLRIFSLFKNRKTWFYCFTGAFQFGLLITDLILLVTNHSVTKKSMPVFISWNTLIMGIILCDIYRPIFAKRSNSEKAGSQTLKHGVQDLR